MALVPLKELLAKHNMSRTTYHKLLNRGLLPHYAKKYGEPGKRGARYLYDSDVFDAAVTAAGLDKVKKGLGIDFVRVSKENAENRAFMAASRDKKVQYLLDCLDVPEGMSMMDFDTFVTAKKKEFEALDWDALTAKVCFFLMKGYRPRV
jgi:hypothetical protein